MRCLTLADALAAQDIECYFICREHPGHLLEVIKQRGHKVYSLPLAEALQAEVKDEQKLAHSDWLGATQLQDAELCSEILQELQLDWLVVDHYGLDVRWEKKLRSHCSKLMVIDDLADRQHDCDLLLDQTFRRDSQDYIALVPKYCQVLCGSEYALLRPEFAQWRSYSLKHREKGRLEHLLINLGGVDKDNITTQILKSLVDCSLPLSCHITVVMGATAPCIAQVQQQAKRMPWLTEVKVGVSNMAELMANSDLAIGAAGATSWERCCLGLPTIMIVLAENQKRIASELEAAGAALFMKKQQIGQQELSTIVVSLSNSPEKLKRIGTLAAVIVDGDGVNTILKKMGI